MPWYGFLSFISGHLDSCICRIIPGKSLFLSFPYGVECLPGPLTAWLLGEKEMRVSMAADLVSRSALGGLFHQDKCPASFSWPEQTSPCWWGNRGTQAECYFLLEHDFLSFCLSHHLMWAINKGSFKVMCENLLKVLTPKGPYWGSVLSQTELSGFDLCPPPTHPAAFLEIEDRVSVSPHSLETLANENIHTFFLISPCSWVKARPCSLLRQSLLRVNYY